MQDTKLTFFQGAIWLLNFPKWLIIKIDLIFKCPQLVQQWLNTSTLKQSDLLFYLIEDIIMILFCIWAHLH